VAPVSASPVHSLLHQLMDMETFFYAYMDDPEAVHALAKRMEPFWEAQLEAVIASPAEVVQWGANYDESTTWPPFFTKEIVPWLARVGDRVRAAGKLLSSHCDGENDRLLESFPDARLDIAESVCTEPMVRRSLRELRAGFGPATAVYGGIPSVCLLDTAMSEEGFGELLDKTFGELGAGERLVLGVSDNVPVDANLDRLERITERVLEFGQVEPRLGA
jgi:uroporphyrinogen-III decarboxylase